MNLIRRRTFENDLGRDTVFELEQGSFVSTDGSVITISNKNHISATSNAISGPHLMWLYPTAKDYTTSYNRIIATKSGYPTKEILHLATGDVVKFVITHVATSNIFQVTKVGFVTGYEQKVMSDDFREKTERTTEIIMEEDVDVTALVLRIGNYSITVELDLEVYVNDVRYF